MTTPLLKSCYSFQHLKFFSRFANFGSRGLYNHPGNLALILPISALNMKLLEILYLCFAIRATYRSGINLKSKYSIFRDILSCFKLRNGFLFDNQSQSFPAISDHVDAAHVWQRQCFRVAEAQVRLLPKNPSCISRNFSLSFAPLQSLKPTIYESSYNG